MTHDRQPSSKATHMLVTGEDFLCSIMIFPPNIGVTLIFNAKGQR